jgi:YesN/AraC family two-component response regulator
VGLSFTKSLIELHKGQAQVTSEEGKGTCFAVTIPIVRESYNASECVKLVEKPLLSSTVLKLSSETNGSCISKIKVGQRSELILIVEDYNDLRDYLASSLADYRVITCDNGKVALKLANEFMPDLILSDILMPEMNGLEMCELIKTNIITSHIPVVLLTARVTAEQKLEGFVHHADAYIEKPFSMDVVAMQIANLLQLRKNISAKYNANIKASLEIDDMSSLDHKFLAKAEQIIEDGIDDPELSVEKLSSELGMSRSQLFRKFRSLINTTPSQFIKVTRLKKAGALLSCKDYNVNEVAFMVGFADTSYFIASFKKFYGITPRQFAENNSMTLVS